MPMFFQNTSTFLTYPELGNSHNGVKSVCFPLQRSHNILHSTLFNAQTPFIETPVMSLQDGFVEEIIIFALRPSLLLPPPTFRDSVQSHCSQSSLKLEAIVTCLRCLGRQSILTSAKMMRITASLYQSIFCWVQVLALSSCGECYGVWWPLISAVMLMPSVRV